MIEDDRGAMIQAIPRRMGVYFLKDSKDSVLYVGKAVDLRSRVRNHLTGSGPHPKTGILARRTSAVDFIPVESEVEALVLEQNLIKEHRPKYNIDLKDDKRYPYLKLTDEDFPRVFKTRRLEEDGARYFGPYTSVQAMEEMLKSLLSIFPLRTCDYEIPFTDPEMRECLEFHIGRCEAPCTRRVSREHYRGMVEEVVLFLEGHTSELVEQMEEEMEEAALVRNYEHAASLRDRITAIQRATERQRVVSERRDDFDLVAFHRRDEKGVGVIYRVREGRLVGRDTYTLTTPLEQPDQEVLRGLVMRHFLRASHIPPSVYLPGPLEEREVLADALSERRGGRVRVVRALRGAPAEVLEMAETDARFRLKDALVKEAQRSDFVPKAITALQEELDLPRTPQLIEAFDVSHVQGSDPVAAMVAFRKGQPEKGRYRKFKLSAARGGDDPAGIAEAVERRYRRLKEEEGLEGLPDLLLIDGGATQLAAAVRILDSLDIDRHRMPVLGLAKRLEEIHLPDVEGPQSLGRSAPAIRLLQRVRDEVHRFAVGYHRQQRGGRVRATLLTEVPGVGEKRARELLRHFGSVKRMLQSGEEAIARVEGIGAVTARRIMETMGGEQAP
ncbi:MAG: excinuclease ABC subunit UvrC [bacterium]